MTVFLAVVTAAVVVCTLLPLWHNPAWWVRSWDFPRLQLFALCLALLAAQAAWLDGTMLAWHAAPTAACLVWHACWIAPYTPLFRKETRDALTTGAGPTLRVLSSNVLMDNRDASVLIAHVRRHEPDILVTLETDDWWQSQLAEIEPDYPHRLACPLDNRYGMHVYSKLRLHDARTEFLVEQDVPSMHATVRLRGGPTVRIHFVHPAPPSPTENEESTERDAELVIVARRIDAHAPTVVTGDLNDVAWSSTTRLFRKLSGLLDPRVGRGMFNTFHAGHWWMRWPLDHLFHSDHFTLVRMQRLPSIGSDHFPILVELAYEGRAAADQEGLEADTDDERRADEIVASAAETPTAAGSRGAGGA